MTNRDKFYSSNMSLKRTNYKIKFKKILIVEGIIFGLLFLSLCIYTFIKSIIYPDFELTTFDYSYFKITCFSLYIFASTGLIFGIVYYYRFIKNNITLKKHYDLLLRSMSHDIKTPINSIIGLVNLSKDNINNTHKVLEYLNKIEVSANTSLKIVLRILELTKVSTRKIQFIRSYFSMNDLIEEISAVIKPLALSKNIDFSIEINKLFYEFYYSDYLKLFEVLVNLLSNAIKYTDCGGKVKLLISEKGAADALGFVDVFGVYEFIVEDNGIGMDRECVRNLFKPYKRGKNGLKEEGHGLGMSITKILTDAMKGNLLVQSKLDVGTKFILEVPIYLDYDKCMYFKKFKYHYLNVLFLDSNLYDCYYTNDIFTDLKMNVVYDIDIEHIDKINFVICDLNNLDDNKKKLLEEANKYHIPIFVVTDNASDEISNYNVLGVYDKPYTRYSIYKMLSNINKDEVKGVINRDYIKGNIIICDDEIINLEVLKALLENNSYNVVSFERAIDAINEFKSSEINYYSHIITDIRMPDINGYELASIIRGLDREDNNIKIISLSGDDGEDEIKKAKRCGIDGFIKKPVLIDDLLNVLDRE